MPRHEGADEYIREVPRPDPDRRRERRDDRERSSTGDRRDHRDGRERREDRPGSDRQRSPAPGGSGAPGGLSDRLLAISAEERPNKPKGAWLTENMKKYKEENGIVSEEEPTEEDIKNQVKLPSKDQIERGAVQQVRALAVLEQGWFTRAGEEGGWYNMDRKRSRSMSSSPGREFLI